MTVLEQVYASGGDVLIYTIELTCEAWDDPILICNGFDDQVCGTEDGRTVTFVAGAIEVALPERSNNGNQNLDFSIDNVTGEAQQKIDAALENEDRIILMYREYLASDLSEPAQTPYRMTVLGGEINSGTVQVQAGYFDLINNGWPRDVYTTTFSPGLRYL
ncbi:MULTISPECIES: DUF1833 family protein [Pseudomonas]|uniref:DUF1833 family protein n=1 Tax=Pseudomonas luteola TaxID=47886 RepID=A0ABS0FPG5_PSELU|nr:MULTISPECIES: DUF1833 family protein [Pseudomonas]MBF8642252.1 DUF1833 family protein [Pseudomonas zeshuii]RRW48361.1 DUF1833 domain-containing protein [Pseudomonas luteola]SHJ24834.1 protein of unknown function [Pseudomonas zeshuii]